MSMRSGMDEKGPTSPVAIISVGVDGSPEGDAALAWATDEAALRGASVQAVNVRPVPLTGKSAWVPPIPDVTLGSVAYQVVQAAIDRLDREAQAPIEIACRLGSVGFALEKEAEIAEAELTVVGRSEGGFGHDLFLGSLSHFLCHLGSRPVVIVPAVMGGAPGRHDRIVVGVDGTARGRAALRWALREAVIRSAAIRALYVWDDVARGSTAGAVLVTPDSERTAADQAASTLQIEVKAALGDIPEASDVPVTAIAVRGSAREALLGEAAQADLLVLGDHKRLVVSEAVLGSTTRTCLRRSRSPVVIVPG
jgi:nucleotide-binding universal stress UspA family protein